LLLVIRSPMSQLIVMPSREESLSKADYEALAEFRYALRKFLGFSEAAASERGVTPQQYQALLAIEGFPGRNWVTIGELAEQMRIAHHSAVGLVDRMAAMRLVKRTTAREDRRRVRVTLTAKGLKLLEKLYRVHREELRSAGPRLARLLQTAASHIPTKITFASPACSMPEIED
jgi:DNA-binding MarR family transcriptional regulator